jgi:hypothetical protein
VSEIKYNLLMENNLLVKLRDAALQRGLINEKQTIDAATAFELVRDMTYQRASDRQPVTLIREWRGTCSGKHYLLQALFAELGLRSRLIACTTETCINADQAHERLRPILERGGGRVVDVHNYLILQHPQGEMLVDATWPAAYKQFGLVVNEEFVPGEDQHIAAKPVEIWEVPPFQDPQEFKDKILKERFSPHELAVREDFIRTLGELFSEAL